MNIRRKRLDTLKKVLNKYEELTEQDGDFTICPLILQVGKELGMSPELTRYYVLQLVDFGLLVKEGRCYRPKS